jgi:dethiobiotin synthetase
MTLVAVVGTATEVGKTWVSCAVLRAARDRALAVAARKPVLSFAPDDATTDADLLAAATGEDSGTVCPAGRRYPLAMAPPMAADALGRSALTIDDLLAGFEVPADVDLCLVETAGGARSPIAHDGDSADLVHRLVPDVVLLVADAGLGTIGSTRPCVEAVAPLPTIVVLNRFDEGDDLHRRNRRWLAERDGLTVVTTAVDALDLLVPPVTSAVPVDP